MGNEILLSIVVPFYNAEKFLKTTITSVLRQNADWFELVLVNDGSSDNSENICKSFNDKRITYINISPNQGAGHARNIGVEKAKGKWIIYLDADDLLLGDFLCSDLKTYLEKKHNSTDLIYTPIISSDIELIRPPEIKFPEITKSSFPMPNLEFVTCIYKKDYLTKNNIKFYEYHAQDVESAYRYLCFSKTDKISVTKDLFYYVRRINPESNMHTNHTIRLSEVKGKVFFDLYDKCDKANTESCAYLYSTFLRQLRKLFTYAYENGGLGKKELYDLIQLYKKSWSQAKSYPLDNIEMDFIKKFRSYLPFLRILLMRNYIKRDNTKKGEVKAQNVLKKDDTTVILQRLDAINQTFVNKF